MTQNPLEHIDNDMVVKITDIVEKRFPSEVDIMKKHELGIIKLDRQKYLSVTMPIDKFIYESYCPNSTSKSSIIMIAVRFELRRRIGLKSSI